MLGYVPFSRKLPSQRKKTEVKYDVYICVHTCACLKKKVHGREFKVLKFVGRRLPTETVLRLLQT